MEISHLPNLVSMFERDCFKIILLRETNTSKCIADWEEAEVVNTCERFFVSESFAYATGWCVLFEGLMKHNWCMCCTVTLCPRD